MRTLAFVPGKSWLYSLNPLVKGAAVVTFMMAFSFHPWGAVGSGAILGGMILVFLFGGVPLGPALGALRRIAVLLAVVGLVNLLQGGETGVWAAADAVLRIVGVFLGASLLIMVSPQAEMMYFWGTCLSPFRLLGLPSAELALVMVIAVRFFPVILGEIERIRHAQMARGARFSGGAGFLSGAGQMMPLLIPTLVLSIHRASDLAVAMESRGYHISKKRTSFREFGIGIGDVLVLWALLFFGCAVIGLVPFRRI